MYLVKLTDEVRQQLAALPSSALAAFAEVMVVLEVAPWGGDPYNRERPDGNIRTVAFVLMHSAINQTKDLVTAVLPGAHSPMSLSGSLAAWLTVAALWICAGYFLWRMSADSGPGEPAGAVAS
jgi:hypothetical protein